MVFFGISNFCLLDGETAMTKRCGWTKWLIAGVLALMLGSLPVAARPERESTVPPLVVRVQYGDSLWTLARQYGDPHRDVRAVVAEITRVNSVDPGELRPGMEITIPAKCLP